jgi:cytidine deaminase
MNSDIDWNQLRVAARAASARAYAPYSHVHVGAAAITTNGTVVVGSNIENASYGLTLCAECSLVSDLIRAGGGRLRAISVVAGDGRYLAPCGRCRQVLFEFGGPALVLDQGDDQPTRTLDELLPGAFGPSDLDSRATS